MILLVFSIISAVLAFLIGCFGGALCDIIITLWNSVLSGLFGSGGLIFEAIKTSSYTSGMWNTAVITASAIETGAAISLTVVFIYMDLIQASASLIDMKRAEHVFKSFIRACITIWIVKNSSSLLWHIFEIVLGITSYIPASTGIPVGQITSGLSTTINTIANGNWVTIAGTGVQVLVDALLAPSLVLILLLVTFIICVYTLISCTIDITMRWIRLILHIAIAPIAVCTIASKQLSFIAKQFFKSYIAVSLEIFFCALIYHFCGAIYTTLKNILIGDASNPGLLASLTAGGFGGVGATTDAAQVCAQLILLCIVFLVFNTSIKKVGQLTAGLTGLQAGN